ncbi:MAG: DNA cytosine methyltransferase, partial [Chryseobacterium sp.]
MDSKKLKHIELFAGCGGMSLGLDSSGFKLFFANELSPMAGETFAFNILNEDLHSKALNKDDAKRVNWIRSGFSRNALVERLRENPMKARYGGFTDIKGIEDLKDKLIVGDIDQLLE